MHECIHPPTITLCAHLPVRMVDTKSSKSLATLSKAGRILFAAGLDTENMRQKFDQYDKVGITEEGTVELVRALFTGA